MPATMDASLLHNPGNFVRLHGMLMAKPYEKVSVLNGFEQGGPRHVLTALIQLHDDETHIRVTVKASAEAPEEHTLYPLHSVLWDVQVCAEKLQIDLPPALIDCVCVENLHAVKALQLTFWHDKWLHLIHADLTHFHLSVPEVEQIPMRLEDLLNLVPNAGYLYLPVDCTPDGPSWPHLLLRFCRGRVNGHLTKLHMQMRTPEVIEELIKSVKIILHADFTREVDCYLDMRRGHPQAYAVRCEFAHQFRNGKFRSISTEYWRVIKRHEDFGFVRLHYKVQPKPPESDSESESGSDSNNE